MLLRTLGVSVDMHKSFRRAGEELSRCSWGSGWVGVWRVICCKQTSMVKCLLKPTHTHTAKQNADVPPSTVVGVMQMATSNGGEALHLVAMCSSPLIFPTLLLCMPITA